MPSFDRPCQVPSLFLLAGEAVALTAGRASRTPADSKFAEMWGGSASVAALRKHREARAKAKPKWGSAEAKAAWRLDGGVKQLRHQDQSHKVIRSLVIQTPIKHSYVIQT